VASLKVDLSKDFASMGNGVDVTTEGLRVSVSPLRRRGSSSREVELSAVVTDLRVGTVFVENDSVLIRAEVAASRAGFTVSGVVQVHWLGDCRRCLEPVNGDLKIEVREVFQSRDSREDLSEMVADAYSTEVEDDEEFVNLEPVVRDTVLLSLPLSPLCREDCTGPDPGRSPTWTFSVNEQEQDSGGHRDFRDPRWSALDVLFESDDEG